MSPAPLWNKKMGPPSQQSPALIRPSSPLTVHSVGMVMFGDPHGLTIRYLETRSFS